MKIWNRLVLASAIALGAATPSFAEEAPSAKTGFYATLGLGANSTRDVGVTYSELDAAFGTAIKGEIKSGSGFSGDIGVGYDFGKFRTELTYVNTNIDVDSLAVSTSTASGTASITSGAQTNSLMFSGYYDFVNKSKWTPYVGAGLGYTRITVDPIAGSITANNQTVSGSNLTDKYSKSLLGYQAKVGVSYEVTPVTNIYLEGTYQGTENFSDGSTKFDGIDPLGGKIGVRYYF